MAKATVNSANVPGSGTDEIALDAASGATAIPPCARGNTEALPTVKLDPAAMASEFAKTSVPLLTSVPPL